MRSSAPHIPSFSHDFPHVWDSASMVPTTLATFVKYDLLFHLSNDAFLGVAPFAHWETASLPTCQAGTPQRAAARGLE